MKSPLFALTLLGALVASSLADPVFNPIKDMGVLPALELPGALKRAEAKNKKVLVFLYDAKGRYDENCLHLKSFAELSPTRAMLKNYVVVLLHMDNHEAARYLQPSDDLERPIYLLLKPDGTLIAKGEALGDARQGLKIMQDIATK